MGKRGLPVSLERGRLTKTPQTIPAMAPPDKWLPAVVAVGIAVVLLDMML